MLKVSRGEVSNVQNCLSGLVCGEKVETEERVDTVLKP